jgi:hypothetical protein
MILVAVKQEFARNRAASAYRTTVDTSRVDLLPETVQLGIIRLNTAVQNDTDTNPARRLGTDPDEAANVPPRRDLRLRRVRLAALDIQADRTGRVASSFPPELACSYPPCESELPSGFRTHATALDTPALVAGNSSCEITAPLTAVTTAKA